MSNTMIFFIVWGIVGLLSVPALILLMRWQTKRVHAREGRPMDPHYSFGNELSAWGWYYYALMIVVGPIVLAATILYICDFELRSID